MKRRIYVCILSLVALFLAGCGAPAGNTAPNSNTNTNTNAKATSAAPTAAELLEQDKKANEAFNKGDKAYFEGFLSDKFVGFHDGVRTGRADELAMIGAVKCDVKSWSLEDPHSSKIAENIYVSSYRGIWDGTCTMGGKTEKLPSPMRAVSIWQREGDKWMGLYHNETLIIDPTAPPPPPAKKDEAKKEEPKSADANSNAEAKKESAPVADANTEALVKLHQAGWEAFKAKDAKWFEANIADSFGVVSPDGSWLGSKADAIKAWTETMKCEGITTVKVSDGFASAIAPNVELLTLTGTADGTCDGQKNGPLYQTAVYVKSGDSWKLAFLFEAPKM